LPVISRALDVQRLRRENAELQEREQRRSEELAAAYQDLESFSYSISHDLRAPLRTIDSFAQILEDDFAHSLGEEARRVIASFAAAARKWTSSSWVYWSFRAPGESASILTAST